MGFVDGVVAEHEEKSKFISDGLTSMRRLHGREYPDLEKRAQQSTRWVRRNVRYLCVMSGKVLVHESRAE